MWNCVALWLWLWHIMGDGKEFTPFACVWCVCEKSVFCTIRCDMCFSVEWMNTPPYQANMNIPSIYRNTHPKIAHQLTKAASFASTPTHIEQRNEWTQQQQKNTLSLPHESESKCQSLQQHTHSAQCFGCPQCLALLYFHIVESIFSIVLYAVWTVCGATETKRDSTSEWMSERES